MNKKFLVKQNDMCDCGACSLLSIIRYYDGDIPLEKIRLDTKTSINGTTAYNIINAARKYGFSANGLKVDDISSRDISFPLIAHLVLKNGLNHFVVVYKIKGNNVYLMDPGKGFTKLDILEFNEIWSRVVLLFNPECKIPIIEKNTGLFTILFNIIINNKKIIFKIFITSILISFISLLISYYIQMFINFSNTYYSFIYIIIFFLFIHILKIYYNYLRNKYIIYLNKNIDYSILDNFLSHIFKLPLNVISSRTSGELITRIYEMNNIKNLCSEIFISIFLDLIFVLCSSIFLYIIDNSLFFILCLIAIIYILIGFVFSPIISKKTNNNIDLETNFNSSISENIKYIVSINNLNINEYAKNKILNSYSDYLDDSIKFQKFLNIYDLFKNIIADIGLFVVNSLGLIFVLNDKISLVEYITFNSLIAYFLEPIKNSVGLIPRFNLIKASIFKIEEFINIKVDDNTSNIGFVNGDISFKNVNYSYDNFNFVLKNVNFIFKKNDRISVIGDSGRGKSTICNILNGNINDYTGDVFINGINIRNYSNTELKNNIIYISQNEELFSDSVFNNICLEKRIKDEDLINAMKITRVDEILNKKRMGLNTFLIDGGFNLSGGEKQRIILCRAILRNPKILILDESLSEVSENVEKAILKDLSDYLNDTTIIYISHGNNTFKKVWCMS